MGAETTVRGVLFRLAMSSFRIKAIAGGAIATLLLASGMLFSIGGFETLADSQIAFIRAQEQEITLTERLRWSGEFLTSAGRGYLISNDPTLLKRLLRVRREFDRSIAALRAGTLTARSESLVAAVERDAERFVRIQEELAAARTIDGDTRSLVLRFERELLPLQLQLSRSLDNLVEYKEAALEESYSQARKERNRIVVWMYALLATLIPLGSVITTYFAKQTARAYSKEQDALGVARKAVAARDDLMGMVAHDLRPAVRNRYSSQNASQACKDRHFAGAVRIDYQPHDTDGSPHQKYARRDEPRGGTFLRESSPVCRRRVDPRIPGGVRRDRR